MSKRLTALTEREQFWMGHLRARGRGSLKAYAAAHELNASSLYETRSRLRRRGLLGRVPVGFARVQRAESSADLGSALCRIHLRNGTVVEVACSSAHWSTLLASVAALP